MCNTGNSIIVGQQQQAVVTEQKHGQEATESCKQFHRLNGQEGDRVVTEGADEVKMESEPVLVEENPVVLRQLAVQLEYYFSKQNLSRDTYVQTLRNLNDGCVPVTILANFAKVKAIVAAGFVSMTDPSSTTVSALTMLNNEEVRKNAIMNVVTKGFSNLLELHSIDTTTGKILSSDEEKETRITAGKTILALGTVTRQPVEIATLSTTSVLASSQSSPSSPISNTIILRDVMPSVTEAEIFVLFNAVPNCPPIIGITRDVANCWFITLDTDAREIMMNIMMQLRSMTLAGEYVMARLKASSSNLSSVDVYAVMTHTDSSASLYSSQDSSVSTNGKKKKVRVKRNRFRKNTTSSSSYSTASGSKSSGNNNSFPTNQKKTIPPNHSPPALTSEDFPCLQDEKKVEWETPPGEDVEDDVSSSIDSKGRKGEGDDDNKSEGSGECPKSTKGVSDGASTATTTSSSTESLPKRVIPMGGYAAALLKQASAPKKEISNNSRVSNQVVKKDVATDKKNTGVKGKVDKADEKVNKPGAAVVPKTVSSGWGQRRSFADILKQDKAAGGSLNASLS